MLQSPSPPEGESSNDVHCRPLCLGPLLHSSLPQWACRMAHGQALFLLPEPSPASTMGTLPERVARAWATGGWGSPAQTFCSSMASATVTVPSSPALSRAPAPIDMVSTSLGSQRLIGGGLRDFPFITMGFSACANKMPIRIFIF